MSSRRWTLPLLAAATALVAVILWLDRGRSSTDEARSAAVRLVPGADPATLDTLELTRGGEQLRLVREGRRWWLAPAHQRADDSAAEALLSTLTYARMERRVETTLRAQAGVDHPRVVIATGGVRLAVGADAPGGVYVLRGAELLVTEHRVVEVADLGRDRLLSRHATLADPSGAGALSWGALRLRRADGVWRITEPPLWADGAAVDALLDALARAQAIAIVAAPAPSPAGALKDAPPAAPTDALTIDGVAEGRVTRALCQAAPAYRVERADGVTLCFSANAWSWPTADALRERRLLPFAVDEVQSIDLHAAQHLHLERRDHAWQILEPAAAAGPADDAAVRGWLSDLAAAHALGFGPAAPTAPATRRLRLGTATAAVELELGLTAAALTARRAGEPDALLLPRTLATVIGDGDPLPLRTRRVLGFNPDDATAIAIHENGKRQDLRRAGDHWLRAPDATPDEQAVGVLVGALADLRAERYLTRAFRSLRTVTVQLAADAGAPPTVELGPKEGEGCLARTPNGPAFLLSAATCAALHAPLK